jgi:biopolymer transport protein ExbD
MTWKIRHQGSPQSIEGLTPEAVVEGLQDGLWETTDEVMGPQDKDWVPIESHPVFAEAAADIELPPPPYHEDESRLDMNPLIDVCLVLLIFFILTTSYAALQQVLNMPGMSNKNVKGKLEKSKEAVAQVTIKVTAKIENGKPVIRVEDQPVALDDVQSALRRLWKATRKTEILFDADGDVPWATVIAIQDAAKGANMQHFHYLEEAAPPAAKK